MQIKQTLVFVVLAIKMEDNKMEIEDKIDWLGEKLMETDQKIDFVIEKLDDLTSWTDGAAYTWDKFGQNYNKDTFRGIKRRIAEQNKNTRK